MVLKIFFNKINFLKMATKIDNAWTSITLGQQSELLRLAQIQGSHVNKETMQLFLEGKNPFPEKIIFSEPEWVKMLRRADMFSKAFEVFEGKSVHHLEVEPLTKEEAINSFLESLEKSWVWDTLEKEMLYTTPSSKNLEVAIIGFGKRISLEDAIKEMDKFYMRPMICEELIQFAIKNPEYLKIHDLVALGSKYIIDGVLQCPTIGHDGNDYFLDAVEVSDFPRYFFHFLFVRK